MSTKTLRVCDAEGDITSDGTRNPCNLAFETACCVCNGDRCTKHSGEDVLIRANINRFVIGVADAGKICAACLESLGQPDEIRAEIGPLLQPLNESIVLVIRASISARVLKDEKK